MGVRRFNNPPLAEEFHERWLLTGDGSNEASLMVEIAMDFQEPGFVSGDGRREGAGDLYIHTKALESIHQCDHDAVFRFEGPGVLNHFGIGIDDLIKIGFHHRPRRPGHRRDRQPRDHALRPRGEHPDRSQPDPVWRYQRLLEQKMVLKLKVEAPE